MMSIFKKDKIIHFFSIIFIKQILDLFFHIAFINDNFFRYWDIIFENF